jgi:hypothetical protein
LLNGRVVIVKSMERTAEGLARTEAELRAEKAAALARIAGTLEGILAELQRRREGFGRLPSDERTRAAEAHDALREQARLYRWYFVVQREALGLFRHEDVDRHYAPPEPLPSHS